MLWQRFAYSYVGGAEVEPKLLTRQILRYVLDTNKRNVMCAWDAIVDHRMHGLPEGRWRDVCDFIRWSEELQVFYDYAIEDKEPAEVQGGFIIEMWAWALNMDWIESSEFIERFGPMFHFEATKTWDDHRGTSIARYVKKLRQEVGGVLGYAGFTLRPSISNEKPQMILLFHKESDAVIAKIYDEQIVEGKKKKT